MKTKSVRKKSQKIGIKYDNQKIRFDLVPAQAEEDIAKVLTTGALKYDDNNWCHLENIKDRYYAAARRHISSWRKGEINDPETGLPHLAHAACCIMFLMSEDNGWAEEVREQVEKS